MACISATLSACALDTEPRMVDSADQKHAELVQLLWHHLRHQVKDLKDGLAEVQQAVAALQKSSAHSETWQGAADCRLQELQQRLEAGEMARKQLEGRITEDARLREARQHEELQAGLQNLDTQLRVELRLLYQRHDETLSHGAKLQDGLNVAGENYAALQRRLALVVEEHSARFSEHKHHVECSLHELQQHMQAELARVSSEHYNHRREQSALLQDSLNRFDAQLRRDMAEMCAEHRSRNLAQQASVQDSSSHLDAKLEGHLGRALDAQASAHADLRSDVQGQLEALGASQEQQTEVLRQQLGALSEEQNRDALLLRRDVQVLQRQAAEANKEATTLKDRLAEVLAVPLINRALQ